MAHTALYTTVQVVSVDTGGEQQMSITKLSDYRRYPNAFIDTGECHDSWIKMAALYKKAGRLNYAFFLTTLDPRLKGIDPHDPNLTKEQKTWVSIEAKYNFWYYVRKIAKIPISGQKKPSPVKANRMVIAFWWCVLNNIDIAIIAPRQQGKSVGSDIYSNWLMHIAGENFAMQLLTKDNKLRKSNIERIKKIRDAMPPYLNFITKDDADNTEELTCKRLENRYLTGVGQKSVDNAENLGRGLTTPYLQIDEQPYVPNSHISLPVAIASATAARDDARRNGTPYGTVITTTAGRRDSKEGAYAYQMIHSAYYWNEALFDCMSRAEIVDMIDKGSSGDRTMVNATFSHRQLGKSDSWARDAILATNSDKDMALRDFLNHWSSGSETSPLSNELNQIIKDAIKEPCYVERTKHNYTVNWYIPRREIVERMQKSKYILACDTSNAVGKDANAVLLVDIRSMEVVASSSIREANLLVFATWLADWLITYDNITAMIENKSSGQAIMDTMAIKLVETGHNPFVRMYNRIFDEPERRREQYNEVMMYKNRPDIDLYNKHKGTFGFMTTGASRQLIYGTLLQRAAASVGHLVNDKLLSDQIRGLVIKNGRVDHAADSHDDMVIAWLLANHMAAYGKSLSNYGIPHGLALSEVAPEGATLSEEDIVAKRREAKLRRIYDIYKEQLAGCKSDFDASVIRMKMKVIGKEIGEVDTEMTVDNLVVNSKTKNRSNLADKMRRVRQRRMAA